MAEDLSNRNNDKVQIPDRMIWTIRPFRTGVVHQIATMWAYRHLYSFFGRWTTGQIYRQTILGIGWLIIQPLILTLSSVLVFGEMFQVSTKPVPLPLFVLVGLSYWFLFRRCIQWMTKNLNMWRGILSRFYIPALLPLLATLFPVLLEYSVILSVALMIAGYFHFIATSYTVTFSWHLIAAFPALIMVFTLALGIGCVTTILNTMARDTWLTMRYILNVWMVATPVLYPLNTIPTKYQNFMLLNPLTPMLELYRWALLHQGQVHWGYILLSCVVTTVVLFAGLSFFAWKQKKILSYH